METYDLLAMRENYNRQRIMLCFNGPISRSLIEEIGNALRNYLAAEQAQPSAAMDVFAVYIEMTQNIRHYATRMNYAESDAAATVAISRDEQGRYVVAAGNLVERDDGRRLVEWVEGLAPLDKAQLKAAYKEQLRKPRNGESTSGAGLGLLDIARKSSAPLLASLSEQPEGRAFFSLRAVIGPFCMSDTMTELNIHGTQSTPAIQGDWNAGLLAMQGDSYPENSFELFGQVIDWVERFLHEAPRPLVLELRLLYLNTSSIKALMDILDLLEEAHRKGLPVSVNWHYDSRNERVAELAEEFREDCSFPFAILPYSE